MACNSAGDIALHIIEVNEDMEAGEKLVAKETFKTSAPMQMHSAFMLAPVAFEETALPVFNNAKRVRLDGDISLIADVALESQGFHCIIPLYHIASKEASKAQHLVYCFAFDKNIFVLFFSHGKLQMANSFPAANESEILYFAVAPIKKAGLNVQDVRFLFLAEAEDLKAIMRTVDRFLPNTAIASIDLPYIAGEYPPYATIAFLLYQYLQCALPEAV
jgi:hypothetical protein